MLVEDDDGYAPAEVLEILADSEEIRGKVVVQAEILDFGLNGGCAGVGSVLETGAVAYFRVEELTGGEGFVGLYFVKHIEGHFVVTAPGNVGGVFV